MSLAHDISAASARHDSILRELSSLDYVPSALAQANSYLDDVTRVVNEAAQRVDEAERAKNKEMKEHHDMQGAAVRRAFSKIVGRGEKWKQKATKEEREFLEALEKEMNQRHALEALLATQREAEQRVAELTPASTRREVLQRELVDLYGRVFDGPTPDAPQDDRLEWNFREADEENNRKQATLSHEAQLLEILGKAKSDLARLILKMSEAEGLSTTDILGIGGPIPDMLEAEAVTSAQGLHKRIFSHMEQACRMSPEVRPIPNFEVPQNSITDICFDNIFSDIRQHEKITTALQRARDGLGSVMYDVTRTEQRVRDAAALAEITSAALNQARSALHDYRREMFENIAHHGPTPGYEQTPSVPTHTTVRDGPPLTRTSYEPPAGPPPGAGSYSPPNGAPSATMSHPQPNSPPTTAFYPPPAGPPTTSLYRPPAGPPPNIGSSHPPVAGSSYYRPPDGPPPSFPMPMPFTSPSAQSGGAGQSSPSTSWQSMNPYAALLVRRGTQEGDNLSSPKAPGVDDERKGAEGEGLGRNEEPH